MALLSHRLRGRAQGRSAFKLVNFRIERIRQAGPLLPLVVPCESAASGRQVARVTPRLRQLTGPPMPSPINPTEKGGAVPDWRRRYEIPCRPAERPLRSTASTRASMISDSLTAAETPRYKAGARSPAPTAFTQGEPYSSSNRLHPQRGRKVRDTSPSLPKPHRAVGHVDDVAGVPDSELAEGAVDRVAHVLWDSHSVSHPEAQYSQEAHA